MEYAEDHYAEFIVPGFSRKHRGKRLQQCRDKPWMEWTTKRPDLTNKQFGISLTIHGITLRTGTSGNCSALLDMKTIWILSKRTTNTT
ncbi:hypothetical protein IW261DRAFT_1500277 [Armillaria novae-zelandiae]|uniref:Uncharacterized protein n=1 Tax=Armillaria novae-zelandiae TaxID=153914 RepID=A0AA39NY63_9AGAR|nr:hypothetical protein IW261DRAFT_1500277 [Armillaria novae-zelandiae]